MRLKKSSLVAALLALQLAAVPAMAQEAASPKGRLVISAEGRIDTAPDMATITLGVATQGKTAAEALSANSTQLGAVLERLRGAGIAERDLQTSGLNLGPQMDYSRDGKPPRITGYEASNMLTVRVRDLAALGGILDQAVGDGANTFHGLSFALTEPQPALDQARVNAVHEARRKAEIIAGAAGVKLGRIVELSEHGGMADAMPKMRSAMGAAAESVPIASGEVTYAVNVSVTWELAE